MADVTAQSLNDTLTRTGALRGIRAQLRGPSSRRSAVATSRLRLKNPLGKDAQIALALIEDFLRVFAFEWTASTAAAEIAGWGERLPATDVPGALQLPKANAAGLPLLLQLIREHLQPPSGNASPSLASPRGGCAASAPSSDTPSPPSR